MVARARPPFPALLASALAVLPLPAWGQGLGLAPEGTTTLLDRFHSALGLLVMLGLAWALSSARRRIPWRVVGWGLGLQFLFGVFVLSSRAGAALFSSLNGVVQDLLSFTSAGSEFVFGPLAREFSFALTILPTVVFFSALMTVLYHLGVMQQVVRGLAWAMQRTMGTSGAETLSAAANVFVGQTEAPLMVKPFIGQMTRSELMAVMVGGFATVAGGVLASYVLMLSGSFPDIAGHLIAASVMSAPAALVVAKIMEPEVEVPVTRGRLEVALERPDANVIDAAARGASEGLMLALNIGAMLLAFIGLVAMLDHLLGLPALWHNQGVWAGLSDGLAVSALPAGCEAPDGAAALASCAQDVARTQGLGDPGVWTPLSLDRLLGWAFWPVAWVMGVPASEASVVAGLLGQKMVLNEFVAYARLGDLLQSGELQLSRRSLVITSYALCGFANFSSIAIQLGGLGGMAPSRRHDLARLGLRAMLGGTLAAFMTACLAGMLIS